MAQGTLSQLPGSSGSYPPRVRGTLGPKKTRYVPPIPVSQDKGFYRTHLPSVQFRETFWFPLHTIIIFGSETNFL